MASDKVMVTVDVKNFDEFKIIVGLLAKTQAYLIELETENPSSMKETRPQLIAEIAQVLGGE